MPPPVQCKMRLYIACFEQSRVGLTSVEYSIGVGYRGINYHCFKFIIEELLQSSTFFFFAGVTAKSILGCNWE